MEVGRVSTDLWDLFGGRFGHWYQFAKRGGKNDFDPTWPYLGEKMCIYFDAMNEHAVMSLITEPECHCPTQTTVGTACIEYTHY